MKLLTVPLLDRPHRTAIVLFVLIMFAYVGVMPPSWASIFETEVSELLFLALLVVLLLVARKRSPDHNARAFFGLMAVAFGIWWSIWPLDLLVLGPAGIEISLAADQFYLLFFATTGAIIELRLDTRQDNRWILKRISAAVGAVLMVLAAFGYFAILPAAATDRPYQTVLYLHASFDAYLGLRFLLAAYQARPSAWRRLYGTFGIAFVLIFWADVVSLLYRHDVVAYEVGGPLNASWYLWYPVAYLATGIRPIGTEKSLDAATQVPEIPNTNPLLFFGLLMPLIHVVGYALGVLALDARTSRDLFVAVWLITIALLLFGLHRYIFSNLRALEEKRMLAETRADRFEEQLNRELRIRSLGRLSSGLAHDFGNTMTAMELHAVAAERKADRGDSATSEFDGVRKSIRYAKRMVEQLKLFGASHERVNTEALSLNAEIGATLDIITPSLGEGVSLTFSPCDDDTKIQAQESMVHQVVTNYVHNAIDAITGTGSIEVATEVATVSAQCRSCGGNTTGRFAILKVCDSGRGVGSDIADSIFEPLVTSKPVGLGSGLGLSSVHGIMHKLGGHVGLTDSPTGGACFIAYFPLAEQPGP